MQRCSSWHFFMRNLFSSLSTTFEYKYVVRYNSRYENGDSVN